MTFSKFLLTVLLLLSCLPAAATPPSEALARQAFKEWLAAHNAGEREPLEAFNARYKVSTDVQVDLDFRESMGSLELVKFTNVTPTAVEALVVTEWGRAMLARIGMNPADAFDLMQMEFEGTAMPEGHGPKPMPMDELVAEARRRLDALESAGKLSGSFLLAHQGRPVLEWTGGLADREKSVPVTTATQFRMASLGKMFTSVAILQLEQSGQLSLDDRLSKHLPAYPNETVADAVTLRQLLNHTSGTGEVFGKKFEGISDTLRTHRDYWGEYAATPLEFEPGAEDRYSNYGYILLGSVVEAVSGQSYYDYVEEKIFRPAGMTSTGFAPESEPVPQRAHAYTRIDGTWTRETASLPWRGTAAGGGYTTAGDLMRFAHSLENGTLVSTQALLPATTAQNIKAWYGYGFMVSGRGDQRQYGHEGGSPGSNAILNVRPATGYAVIGLSNFDPASMANVVNFVTHRLP